MTFALTSPGDDTRATLLVAGALFAVVFALRALVTDPYELITLLYSIPIAIVAVRRGMVWGVLAAVLALALFALWGLLGGHGHDASDYAIRGAVFLTIGGATGGLADRLRSAVTQSERFWDLSADLLCVAGFDGYFKRVNPAWERTLGWSTKELLAAPFIDLVHPDDRERTVGEMAKLREAGFETLFFESRLRCRDGGYRTLQWGARAIVEEDAIYASGSDITERNRAEAQLRESERFLDSVLENLPNMVFVKDASELRFVRFNRAGEKLLGTPRTALLGKSDHDLFPSDQADAFVERDRHTLETEGIVDVAEEPLETGDHGTRILHTRKIAIRDDAGRAQYLLGISEDITERKVAEREAEEARALAEQSSQAKSEFLSRMSHELRTPLNAVIGFGQLLELSDLDEGDREAVEQILKGGRHLLELINEVLDISRIEAGTMSMSLEPVHLGSVVADVLSLIRPLTDDAGLRLTCDPSRFAELHVLADQQRLKQVLINLLSNAVKYNRRGGQVCVECGAMADGRVGIAVADTGLGMDEQQMQRLFTPFDRLGAEGGAIEGTGLGLSLCKGLVEAMGGAIRAASEAGVGTTFHVELHAAAEGSDRPVATGSHQAFRQLAQQSSTIVYIEDNLSNLRLVEQLLARLPGVRLISALHGRRGIELVAEHRPDLVLLDLHLPDLSGAEVLHELKRDPDTASIPVVVLSADATSGQHERLRAGGAADFVTKPIEFGVLLDAVANQLAVADGARER